MTNFIDLNVLNFFVSISNKGFHILDSIMIFFTVLGDDGHIFIAASIILLIFKKTRSLVILLAISLLLTLAVSSIMKHEVHRLRPYEVWLCKLHTFFSIYFVTLLPVFIDLNMFL